VICLLGFSLLVTTRQYVGNPIDCVHTKDIPEVTNQLYKKSILASGPRLILLASFTRLKKITTHLDYKRAQKVTTIVKRASLQPSTLKKPVRKNVFFSIDLLQMLLS
jgi:hypothetical protein